MIDLYVVYSRSRSLGSQITCRLYLRFAGYLEIDGDRRSLEFKDL